MTFPTLPTVWVPPLNCNNTRDGTCEDVHSRCTCSKKIGSRNESIQFKRQKERNPDLRLCWYGCIMIQTWSYRGAPIFVEKEERVSEVKSISFWYYCLSQRRNREYDPEGFLCVRVCVCVWARACGRHVGTTQASLLDGRPLPHFRPNLVQVHEFLKKIAG